MNTLIVHSWYTESLDKDLKPLPQVTAYARLSIDGSQVKLEGEPNIVNQVISLLKKEIKEVVLT